MLSDDQIRQILKNGEGSEVEFKASEVRAESVAKTFTAFSNTQGGYLLIGVSDTGQVTGALRPDLQDWIINIARQNIDPPVLPSFSKVTLDNTELAIAYVPCGSNKPYRCSTDQHFYIRAGSSNRIASSGEIGRLFARAQWHYDEEKSVPRSSSKDLNMNLINEYFEKIYQVDTKLEDLQRLLKNASIVTDSGELSLGGLLLFGSNPQAYFPELVIRFAHFRGTALDSPLIDKQVIDRALVNQLQESTRKILLSVPVPSDIVGLQREDQFTFSEKMLREALVNALAHRDYGQLNEGIFVYLFSDRLEIRNPGGLLNTLSIENIKTGKSVARNPFILKYMENLRYMDHLGRGIPMLFQEAQRMQKSQPTISCDVNAFKLTLWR